MNFKNLDSNKITHIDREDEKENGPYIITQSSVGMIYGVKQTQDMVEFEDAIALAGYGKFHYILLIIMLPASVTTLFSTSGISFILPAAICDLNTSTYQIGLLNGAIYVGMVSSSFLWGFLSDTLGRKNLLFVGLVMNGTMEVIGGLVQTYWLLFLAKFLSGFATCGPFALLYTYLSEFVGKNNRDNTVMRAGTLAAFAFIIQPVLAYLVIPHKWTWIIPGTNIVLNNWRAFLIICSVPSLSAACCVLFLSETPKFLVSRGRTQEALHVLRTMYAINTGNSPETFPIKQVYIDESNLKKSPKFSTTYKKDAGCDVSTYLKSGWEQVSPLFQRPYVIPALITFFAQFITMLTQNSIRLLLPNLFAFMLTHSSVDKSLSLCEIWTIKGNTTSPECTEDRVAVSSDVYLYSIVVGIIIVTTFFLATPLVKLFGKTRIFCIFHVISAVCIIAYPWSPSLVALVLAALYVAVMQNSVSIAIGVMVQRVPTQLRVMTVSMLMMTGRIGVIIGNLSMPFGLTHTCLGSFIFIGCLNLRMNYGVKQTEDMVEFEDAIALAGYGKFHYILLIIMLPASVTTLFTTSGISFILPAAICDLNLSTYHIGSLNGAAFVGMVFSSFLWGFLSDTLGRKNLLFIGLVMNGTMEVMAGLVQTYWLLFLVKFLSGCATCGPFALLYTYLSEFVGKNNRDSTVMRAGTLAAFAFIIQPALAYLVIPHRWTWIIPGTNITLNNWRAFLLMCSVPSLSAACCVLFLSETPKFLVSRGRTQEALHVLRTMYAVNTGNSPETFPVKRIYIDESNAKKSNEFSTSYKKPVGCNVSTHLKTGWEQIRPLFERPYVIPALITFFAQFITMLTQNSIRLLLPNLFSFMLMNSNVDKSLSLCEIWSIKGNTTSSACTEDRVAVSSDVYLYSIVVGLIIVAMFFLATPLVKLFGKTRMFCFFHVISAVCITVYPWSPSLVALVLAALYVAVMQNSVSIAIGVMVQRVPTQLRAMTVSMLMMMGRVGVIIGNLSMPFGLTHTCLGSFIFIGCLNLLCAPILLLLPKIDEGPVKM